MNIIINKKKFVTAIKILERAVSRNISLPILSNILFKTSNNKLKLSATNLELGITYWLGVKIEKEGETAVPAKILSDFLNNIDDEKILLSLDKNSLKITSDKYETKILVSSSSDFPIIPKNNGKELFTIDSYKFKEALSQTIESSSISETRPELNGVFIGSSEKMISIAATDSFRLAERLLDIKDGQNKSIIIPRTTVLEIIRILDLKEQENLILTVSDNQVFILGSDFELISRLIDGHYPEYKKIIPEKYITTVTLNKKELEKNIRMASIFSSSISDIKISVDEHSLKVSAKNSDRGEINSKIDTVIKGSPFEILINYNYILDGIKIIKDDNVLIEFTGQGSPLVIKGEKDKSITYVIMPLRS